MPERLIDVVMALYSGTKSKVCAAGGISENFDIGDGVHQGLSSQSLSVHPGVGGSN